MGGDCSQKLSPGGEFHSSPGHSKPPAQLKINTVPQMVRRPVEDRSAHAQGNSSPRAVFLFFVTRSFFPNQFVFHTFAR